MVFNGIANLVGYLKPNPVYIYTLFLFLFLYIFYNSLISFVDRKYIFNYHDCRRMLTSLSIEDVLLPESMNFWDLPLRVKMAPSCLKRVFSVLFWLAWRPMLPAVGYAVEIRFGQVYLQEALDHLHSFCRISSASSLF